MIEIPALSDGSIIFSMLSYSLFPLKFNLLVIQKTWNYREKIKIPALPDGLIECSSFNWIRIGRNT